EQVGSYLVPLFARALDGQAGPAVIEECCKALQDCIGTLDYTLLKAELVPRLHAACMRTTSGSVRVYTLTLMAKVVGRLDREEANKIIDTAAQVVAVDRSASTLVCTAGLVDALSKQWGAE
ncbi:SCY1-like protein 2, partial [Haematococcus lacustris]